MKKVEVDSGRKPGLTTDMAAKMKALERENQELRQANNAPPNSGPLVQCFDDISLVVLNLFPRRIADWLPNMPR